MLNKFALTSIIVVFIFSSIINGKAQTLFSSQILDNTTKEELPFANVYIKGKSIGTSSNEKGEFSIYAQSSDTLIVSYIGYLPFSCVLSDLDSITFLKPPENLLNKVEISSCRSREKLKIENRGKRMFAISGFNQYVMLLKNPKNEIGFVEKITIDTTPRAAQTGRYDILVRLRVYKNENNLPTDDLLTTNIYKRVKKGQTIFAINLKDYDVFLPKNGCFIGVEVVGKYNKKNEFFPCSDKDITKMSIEVGEDNEGNYLTYFKEFGKEWKPLPAFPKDGEFIKTGARFWVNIVYYK